MKTRICRDCAYGAAITFKEPPKRPAPYPGPRCASHHKAVRDARKDAQHDAYVVRTYGLKPGDYGSLYAIQGGRCALCLRATGKNKRLAVDHDHKTGAVRGLCCGPCNSVLAHARDDTGFFVRAIDYLKNPPAQQLEEQ